MPRLSLEEEKTIDNWGIVYLVHTNSAPWITPKTASGFLTRGDAIRCAETAVKEGHNPVLLLGIRKDTSVHTEHYKSEIPNGYYVVNTNGEVCVLYRCSGQWWWGPGFRTTGRDCEVGRRVKIITSLDSGLFQNKD